MTECVICGETEKRLVRHHTDYEKNTTVLLCDKCHRGIHNKTIISDVPVPVAKEEKDKEVLNSKFKLTFDCYDVRERSVPLTSGYAPKVEVPKKWAGHDILLLLVNQEDEVKLPVSFISKIKKGGSVRIPSRLIENLELEPGVVLEVSILQKGD